MKSIVEYARQKAGDTLTVELQTNGVFGNSVRQWLIDNVNIVWISFDGEPDVHNANRPCANGKPSSPIIEDNVKWLAKNGKAKGLMIGARVTVTDMTANNQEPIVDYLSSLGIRYIWNDPLFPSVGTIPVCDDEPKKATFVFNMDAYVDGYVKAFRRAKDNGVFYGSFLTCNFDGVCNKHCRACTPVPHFTTDGYVSACDLVTFGEDAHHMDGFVYGKWNDGTQAFEFDEDKIRHLRERTTDNMSHCRTCDVSEHCGGYCLGEVMNESGSLLGQKPITCKAIRRLAKEIGLPSEPYSYLHP
jgi:radical SAM protein with 4Fe4S-binding SPASM domain